MSVYTPASLIVRHAITFLFSTSRYLRSHGYASLVEISSLSGTPPRWPFYAFNSLEDERHDDAP
jgi:hypothetical protein